MKVIIQSQYTKELFNSIPLEAVDSKMVEALVYHFKSLDNIITKTYCGEVTEVPKLIEAGFEYQNLTDSEKYFRHTVPSLVDVKYTMYALSKNDIKIIHRVISMLETRNLGLEEHKNRLLLAFQLGTILK